MPGESTRFKPGQSGNPGGVPKTKLWRQALLREVERASREKDTTRLDMLARKLVAKAMTGDVAAIKEIGDRIDGKPPQDMNLGASDSLVSLLTEIASASPDPAALAG